MTKGAAFCRVTSSCKQQACKHFPNYGSWKCCDLFATLSWLHQDSYSHERYNWYFWGREDSGLFVCLFCFPQVYQVQQLICVRRWSIQGNCLVAVTGLYGSSNKLKHFNVKAKNSGLSLYFFDNKYQIYSQKSYYGKKVPQTPDFENC